MKERNLEPKKVERWLREQARQEGLAEEVSFVKVEEKTEAPEQAKWTGKYRLRFESGAWLEVEGSFALEGSDHRIEKGMHGLSVLVKSRWGRSDERKSLRFLQCRENEGGAHLF